MALGIGASFLLPALRRRAVAAGPVLGGLLGPVAVRLAREGAERMFTFAVEHLQKQQQTASADQPGFRGAGADGSSRHGAKHRAAHASAART